MHIITILFVYVFYPSFGFFALLDLLGFIDFQMFWTGIFFTIPYMIAVLVALCSYGVMLVSEKTGTDRLPDKFDHLCIRVWLWLLVFELLSVGSKIWVWFGNYRDADAYLAYIKPTREHGMSAFVQWLYADVFIIILAVVHVYQSLISWRSIETLLVPYEMENDKKAK